MCAIIRQNNYSLTKLPNTGVLDEKIQRLHGSQPEYFGSPTVRTGEGIQIVVNVLDSEEHANAGRGAIGESVRKPQEQSVMSPPQLISAGPVVGNDLSV